MRKKLLSAFLAFTLSVGIAVPSVLAADAETAQTIGVIGDSITADTLYHEAAADNWYTGLVADDGATVKVSGTATAKVFDVEVPFLLEASVALKDTMLAKAKEATKTLGDLNDKDTATLTLGFQLGLPEKIDSTAVDYSKTTVKRTVGTTEDTKGVKFVTATGAFVNANEITGDVVAKTAVLYGNAISFKPGSSFQAEGTEYKVMAKESKRTYVYSFYAKPTDAVEAEAKTAAVEPTLLATYTVNITTTPKAATPDPEPEPGDPKAITVTTTPANEQTAVANAELVKGFGFTAKTEEKKITVTGATAAEKLQIQAGEGKTEASFATYFQVAGVKVADVGSIEVSVKDGKTLNVAIGDMGLEDVTDKGLHFNLSDVFATKTDSKWAFDITSKEYKVELFGKVKEEAKAATGEVATPAVLATVEYSVDFTGATIKAEVVDPNVTTEAVAVITNNALKDDTLYHEGQITGSPLANLTLGGNWYTGLADDGKVEVTTTTTDKNKEFNVKVPLNLVGGSKLTGKALEEAKVISGKPGPDATGKSQPLGFQLALPTKIGETAIDFSKTTITRKNDGVVVGDPSINFGITDGNRAASVKIPALGENTVKTAVMYASAVTVDTVAEVNTYKVIAKEATRQYVYTFRNKDNNILATYTINFTTTPKAAPAAKPITFSTEAKNGQTPDHPSELKGADKGFGFAPVVTANSITVTGKTTAEKLAAQPDKAAFVTYFQVADMKKGDVTSVRTTRDGKVLSTTEISAGAIQPEDKDAGFHFKLGTMFATEEGTPKVWTMKYAKPYTQTVDLLDAHGIVIASVTYTVDLSGAVIGNTNVTVTSPETGTGVVAGDIPSKVEIPNGDKTLADIKVATGIQDADGKDITATDVTKVDLKVAGISTEDATPAVVADKKLINAQPAIAKDGAKVAFLDIKLEFTVNTVKKLISTLGDKAVEILVAIPANLISEGATYTIFTVHNNKLSPITPELSFDKKSLRFNANKFSTFAIVATPKAAVIPPPPVNPDVPTPPTPPVNPSNPTPPASNNSGSTYTGGSGGGSYYSYDSRPTYGSVTTITDKTALGVAITFPIGIRGVATPSFTVSELAKMDDEFRVFMALAQGFDVLSVYDINLFDSNRKVTTVDGGLITVTLPYAQGKAGVNYKILRNNEDGTITELPATFNGGLITFETNRFGKFSVAVSSGTVIPSDTATTLPAPDTTTPAPAPTVPPTTANPQTGDVNPIGLLAILLIAGASMLVISKKVRV